MSGGEISPELYSRADTVKYSQGLKTCRNWVVNTNGSVSTRPGTIYCEPHLPEPFAAAVNRISRLIPFYQSETQNYVLVLTQTRMRFLKNGKYIKEAAKNISAITRANPGVVTSAAHGFVSGDYVFLSVAGMTELNGKYFKVFNETTDTFELVDMYTGSIVDTSSFGVYVPTGTAERVYSLATSYAASELQYLRYAQAADVMTFVTTSDRVQELSYISDLNWTLTDFTPGPTIASPGAITVTGGAAGPTVYAVQVTAVSATGEESLATSSGTFSGTVATAAAPIFLDWANVTGAASYNIYSFVGGGLGYIGTSQSSSFSDTGIVPDFSIRPPVNQTFFGTSNEYPGAITYHQSRLALGGSTELPQTIWMSKPGIRENFLISTPSQSNDGLQFSIVAKARTRVIGLLSADDLFCFTSNAEYLITGDNANILRPDSINARRISTFGISLFVSPLLVGTSPIFVQASSGKVFELDYLKRSSVSGGLDLTTFSSHLVDKFTIVDWEHQQNPQSIIWSCRSDGVLLGCTYDKDQQVLAWHRHDTDGLFQNITTIPEVPNNYVSGSQVWPVSNGTFRNAVYFIVERTVNGQTWKCIEKLADREINDIVDYVGMDCATTFDLTSLSTGIAVTLSGGATWDDGETITATFTSAIATPGLIGSELRLEASDGTEIRFRIQGYTSTTVVTGMVNRLVPASLRGAASDYLLAQKTFTGLLQLEGKQVSIFADGYVVASPNNSGYPVYTVTNGSITLDTAATVVTVGIPFVSDIKTLDADLPSGETISDKKQLVTRVTMDLVETRGLFVGADQPTGSDPLANLVEMKLSDNIFYDDPIALKTGKGEVQIQGKWDASGSVFVRQVDPLPATLGSIIPAGQYAFGSSRRRS
jgi:hypothetical protein